MNQCQLMGRLVRDPELKYTPQGTAVTSFTLAVDRRFQRDAVDFIDCVAWEKKAEFVSRNFRKGQRIEVSGILTTRQYEKDGQKRKATEIRCDQVFFGDSKKSDSSPPTEPPENSDFQEVDAGDEELPF